ncbi:hypothetical protein QBC46DRAFT_255051 [Diplogelasinospora grovesii]|uniref:Life-span regulatory factor domain-containing protein n=1 Tax=Diplogelasinospora grovesii TaxID=303347 RepID=A0AAN6S767_9PEZI|nr:hypothetical protein QBC46DRAFT_255051 [Diplogelasinospora grovesii]
MYHHRRKSGHSSGHPSMTDVRKTMAGSEKHKSSRPTPKRTPSQLSQKLGKNPRDRERDFEEGQLWDDERESFPQYCMICGNRFTSSDERVLYCSESCRDDDQTSPSPSTHHVSYAATHYPMYSDAQEPRDIIPRASPSRPSSMHFSPPVTPNAPTYSSAYSALKSLSIRPPSPPSPTGTYHSSLWPFTRSAATSPSTSYAKPTSGFFSSTYDGTYYANGYGTSSDRPLPPRRPGGYSRPKSIELVTPMLGR